MICRPQKTPHNMQEAHRTRRSQQDEAAEADIRMATVLPCNCRNREVLELSNNILRRFSAGLDVPILAECARCFNRPSRSLLARISQNRARWTCLTTLCLDASTPG